MPIVTRYHVFDHTTEARKHGGSPVIDAAVYNAGSRRSYNSDFRTERTHPRYCKAVQIKRHVGHGDFDSVFAGNPCQIGTQVIRSGHCDQVKVLVTAGHRQRVDSSFAGGGYMLVDLVKRLH